MRPFTALMLCVLLSSLFTAHGERDAPASMESALAPRGSAGEEVTLARDGKTDYVIVASARPDGRERKAADELARWLGEMTGATFPLIGMPCLQNGDFEEGGGWLPGLFPTAWVGPTGNYGSPARPQTGVHAIGGSGTSAFMPAEEARNGMEQAFLNTSGGTRWTFEMDFACEDPEGQARAPEGAARAHFAVDTPAVGA